MPIIINKGSQPKDPVTFLSRDSVNLTADHPFIHFLLRPAGREDREALFESAPAPNLPEQSRPIRHLANGRPSGPAKAFQRQDLAPWLRSLRFLCSQTSSGWRDVGGRPHPRSAEPQQRDLKAGDKGGELEPRAAGRAELSGSLALREQDRAEAKGSGTQRGGRPGDAERLPRAKHTLCRG